MKKLFMALMMAAAMFCTTNIANTAYAEGDYIADAELASSNISAIYTICPGMSYDNVIANFSGTTEWTKYEKSLAPGNNGDEVAMIHFVKGTADDAVTEDIDVFFCNGIATSVNCKFLTDDEDVAIEICDFIISNVQQQIPCNVSENNGRKRASAKVNDDEWLRVCIYERDNYDRPTTNPENAHYVGKRYDVIFEDWVKGDYRPHNSII